MATIAEHVFSSRARLSLRDHIQMLGIPELPRNVVRAHKVRMVRQCRAGIFTLIGPAVLSLLYLLMLSTGLAAGIVWRRYSVKKVSHAVRAFSLMGAFLFPLLVAWAGHLSAWPVFFFTPLFAALALRGFIQAISLWRQLNTATSHWEAVRVTADGRNAGATLPPLPRRLRQRAQAAATIPGVRFAIEYFKDDPFLVIERGHGPLTERVYIGAWNTGCPQLDGV